MASNNTSPGVYTSERELNFNTETVGVTTLGLVGETLKGPAFQPIFVSSFDNFTSVFGGTSAEKYKGTQIPKYELPYIGKAYLSQSNQLYVTRVLGLSGYDAGNAFMVKTLGAMDMQSLVSTGATGTTDIILMYDSAAPSNGFKVVTNLSGTTGVTLSTYITTNFNSNASFVLGDFSTAYNAFYKLTGAADSTDQPWRTLKAFYWGYFNDDQKAIVTASSNASGSAFSGKTYDSYVLPSTVSAANRDLHLLKTKSVYVDNTDTYVGNGFSVAIQGTTNVGLTGTTRVYLNAKIYNTSYVASPFAEGHKKVVAVLRSRGSIVTDQLVFKTNGSSVSLVPGFSTAVLTNPFADFTVTGTTTASSPVNFSHTLSLDTNKKSFVKNVLGKSNSDKDTALYCTESYPKWLKKQYEFGLVGGLMTSLERVTDMNHFKFQYQTPATPFIVSEIRGGNVVSDLFKFVSISDGDDANTEVKVSIANVDLSNKTFDVLVRNFADSDTNPIILERFVGCVLDKTSSDFIGRKIGTDDGEYTINSKYIYVQMAENAPNDAIPCGFKGYVVNNTGLTSTLYSTKYYTPNELITAGPTLGSPIYSNGDKVRKKYLGVSDVFYGFDADLFKFKGKDNNGTVEYNVGDDFATTVKGFHFDNAADTDVFITGADTFNNSYAITDPTNKYFDIKTRKFTVALAGGFDGWDIYRDSRSNTDTYKIGRTGFVNGEFDTFIDTQSQETYGNSDYYAYLTGIKTFENPEQITLNIFATPGIDIINNTELVRDALEMIEEVRLDTVYFPTLPDISLFNNTNPANSDEWLYPSDIVNALDDTEIISSYTSVFYPWLQISDVNNSANIFIPPTAEVVKNIAFTDNVSQPWFATAGYTRGKVNAKKTRFTLKQSDRDTLYDGRINPIATFSDVGIVIWGNRTTYNRNTPLRDLNIRRLLLQARKLVVAVSNRLLFDQNDNTVRNQFTSQVTPILDNIRKERGLSDFRIVLSDSSDRNTLVGKIYLKPTSTLEFIELEFVVTPDSVSFSDL